MKKICVSTLMILLIVCLNAQTLNAREMYLDICEEVGGKYCISPEFLQAMVEAESDFDPNCHNSYDATGLMQVVPRFHKERIKQLGITNLYDPYQNILCGADFVAELVDKYHDPYLVLMCYNMGEYGNAKKLYKQGRYSKYAVSIMDRVYELEEINGKHDYY